MKSKFLFVFLAISLLGGCVRYSNGEPVETEEENQKKEEVKKDVTENSKSKKEQQKTRQDEPVSNEAEIGEAAEAKKEEVNQEVESTTAIKTYFEQNFFGTSWYSLITDIKVTGDTATIHTSVFPDDEGKKALTNVSTAVWGFTNSNDSKVQIKYIDYMDKNGNALMRVNNPMN